VLLEGRRIREVGLRCGVWWLQIVARSVDVSQPCFRVSRWRNDEKRGRGATSSNA